MKNKQWVFWLLVVMMLLAACGGEDGGETAVFDPTPVEVMVDSSPDSPIAPAMESDTDDPAEVMVDSSPDSPITPAMESDAGNEEEPIAQPIAPDLTGLEDAEKAVQILAAQTAVSDFLAAHPNWTGESWQEDEESYVWEVDLYDESGGDWEWLGWGAVNIATGEVLDYFIPRELSPEEFQAGMAQVEKLVLNDAGVQARLGDPDLWEYTTEYDPYEETWATYFWRGVDELAVIVYLDEEGAYLDEIVDLAAMDAEQAEAYQRDQAVELSWEADGIDQALDGVDNWHTLVAPQGDLWAVSYVTNDEELFFVLVDIEKQTILEIMNNQ